jgi:hyperosmotically inducible protein
MKALAIAVSVLALGLAACAQQPRTGASGGATAGVKQDAHNAALTGKVKAALAADVGLRTLKIDVDSEGNTVTLNGVVDSEGTKQRAASIARSVQGVAAVKNNLTVKNGG